MATMSCRAPFQSRASRRRPSTTKPHFSYTRRARGLVSKTSSSIRCSPRSSRAWSTTRRVISRAEAAAVDLRAGQRDAKADGLVVGVEVVEDRLAEERSGAGLHGRPVGAVVLLAPGPQPRHGLLDGELGVRAGQFAALRVGEHPQIGLEDIRSERLQPDAVPDEHLLMAEQLVSDHPPSQPPHGGLPRPPAEARSDEFWSREPSGQQGPHSSEVLNVRKVVVYELLSLDGVAEEPDGFFADWDDAMDANLAAVIAAQDSVILGRRSYDEWAEFWPGSDIEPFATFINGVAKYVATSTPLDRPWANTTVVDGELVAFVRDLKNRPGGDIGVHASISVAQALLAAGVVDELRLVIAPTIAGSGRRLLDGLPAIRLESIRSTTSPTGSLLVDYRVIP